MSVNIKKKTLAFSILALLIIVAIVLFHFLMQSTLPKFYLTNKYSDMNYEELEVVSYTPNKIDKNFFFLEQTYIHIYPKKWVFKYKDKNFNVEFFNLHFVDDYQLEELETMCTEYLKNNIDSNIQGITIYSDTIYSSKVLLKKENNGTFRINYDDNKLWTKDNVELFINNFFRESNQTNYCSVYIYFDNVSPDIITEKINQSFPELNDYYLIQLNTAPLSMERYRNTSVFNELYTQEAYGYIPSNYVKEKVIVVTKIKNKEIIAVT